jgi:hypothetical protein
MEADDDRQRCVECGKPKVSDGDTIAVDMACCHCEEELSDTL